MWKDVVVNATKVQVNKKEPSGVPFTKARTSMRAENNE